MRLFIGTWVRNNLYEQLTQVLEHYAHDYPQLKWTSPHKLHLTLLYLGETDHKHLELIKNQLNDIARQTATMLNECQQSCLLPSTDNPKVLAYKLKTHPNLLKLHQHLQHALKPDQKQTKMNFKPHITLARQPKSSHEHYSDLSQAIIDLPIPTAPLIIDHMALVSAPVSQTGSIYQTLDEYALKL